MFRPYMRVLSPSKFHAGLATAAIVGEGQAAAQPTKSNLHATTALLTGGVRPTTGPPRPPCAAQRSGATRTTEGPRGRGAQPHSKQNNLARAEVRVEPRSRAESGHHMADSLQQQFVLVFHVVVVVAVVVVVSNCTQRVGWIAEKFPATIYRSVSLGQNASAFSETYSTRRSRSC